MVTELYRIMFWKFRRDYERFDAIAERFNELMTKKRTRQELLDRIVKLYVIDGNKFPPEKDPVPGEPFPQDRFEKK